LSPTSRKYIKVLVFAGEKQKQKIEIALHKFGQEMLNVKLWKVKAGVKKSG